MLKLNVNKLVLVNAGDVWMLDLLQSLVAGTRMIQGS
jgi:hypothetical protein